MSTEPGQFRPSAKPQLAPACPLHGKVALAKDVHPENRVERETLSQLEAIHCFEHEWQKGALHLKADPEQKPLYLRFASGGSQRSPP